MSSPTVSTPIVSSPTVPSPTELSPTESELSSRVVPAESSSGTLIGSPHVHSVSSPTESPHTGPNELTQSYDSPTESSKPLDVSIAASVGFISTVVIITVLAIIILAVFFVVRKSKGGGYLASVRAPYFEGSVVLDHIATRDLQGRDNPVYSGSHQCVHVFASALQ